LSAGSRPNNSAWVISTVYKRYGG